MDNLNTTRQLFIHYTAPHEIL